MAISSKSSKSELLASLQASLDKAITSGVPGISASIHSYPTTPLWSSVAGQSNLQTSVPIDFSHIFGIGSITKVFVAVVIFQLIDSGHLTLSTRLDSILSPSALKDIDNAPEAIIASMLNHTSGIDTFEEDPLWIPIGRGRDIDPTRIWGKTEPLDYIRRPNPNFAKPGSWEYSNSNYTLLGLVIETLTSHTAESEIRTRILEPLGMKSTFLEGFEEVPKGTKTPNRYHWATSQFLSLAGMAPSFSHPPGREDLIDVSHSNLSVEWTDGGLVSSPSDLCLFANALQSGSLMSASSKQEMNTWLPNVMPGRSMGRGVFKYVDFVGEGTWMGHFGGVLGFNAALVWREGVSVAVCANVGSMHCGEVKGNTALFECLKEITGLASELVELE